MKYQLFAYRAGACSHKTGIRIGEEHFDLGALAERFGIEGLDGCSIYQLLGEWGKHSGLLRKLVADAVEKLADLSDSVLDLDRVRFGVPMGGPVTIYGAGANYRDHVEAMAKAFSMNLCLDPKSEGVPPWHFIKPGLPTMAATGEEVKIPHDSKMFDWEAELAVIIGKSARNVEVENAGQYIAGYSCANDLSARDMLKREQVDASSPFRFDWIGHKCFTGSCPLGPYFTPAEFVEDAENLDIKLWRNGKIEQNSNTCNHLYNIAEQISYLSKQLELLPGDIILTGTPAGVGTEKGVFLKSGDTLKVWIEGLGELDTSIV